MAPSRCIFITFFRNLTLVTEQRSRRSLSLKMTMWPLLRKASPPSRDGAGEYAAVTDGLKDIQQVARQWVLEQNATRLSEAAYLLISIGIGAEEGWSVPTAFYRPV